MTRRSSIELIGDLAHCNSFDAYVALILTRPKLVHATFASAYLTDEAAHRIVSHIASRSGEGSPTIRFLVGTMNRFTRKSAIRILLKAARSQQPIIEVLCPESDHFHIKAAYARTERDQIALVGSHNLTREGLLSNGELGVVLSGADAKPIDRVLSDWARRSAPWSRRLRTYKEGRLPVHTSTSRIGEQSRLAIHAVASTVEATELTATEQRLVDGAWRLFCRNSPALAAQCARPDRLREGLLLYRTVADAWDQGYFAGACFDISALGDEEPWENGQCREVRRIAALIPLKDERTVVIPYRKKLASYVVTEEIARVANKLGIRRDDGIPTASQLQGYIDFLRRVAPPRAS